MSIKFYIHLGKEFNQLTKSDQIEAVLEEVSKGNGYFNKDADEFDNDYIQERLEQELKLKQDIVLIKEMKQFDDKSYLMEITL
jgi:hypothetical protein